MLFHSYRSSYPDYKEGQDPAELEALSTDKILECDDETMELILPSGKCVCPNEVAWCQCIVEEACLPQLPAALKEKEREPLVCVCVCVCVCASFLK